MNQVTIKTRIGGQIIEASAGNLLDAIALVSPLAEMPERCGKCNFDNIAMSHREAQGYHFYGVRCRSCGGEFPCGQKKVTGELFPKGPWEHPRRGEAAPEHNEESYDTPRTTSPSQAYHTR